MDMLSGSQISSFLSATSLMWASSIVLIMVGLVYFIKYKERHDSIKKSRFFILYVLIIILNILELVMNIVMKNNPSYEIVIYKLYIFIKFFLNISLIFYIIDYINSNNKMLSMKILKMLLILIAVVCCITLDIDVVLENSGKFYILTGTLNSLYTIWALVSNSVLLVIILTFREKMPKGFCLLCIMTFLIYIGMVAFKNITGYAAKESIFIYSLMVLIIFNTTSNQDKNYVNRLSATKNALLNINNRRNKLIDKIDKHIGQSLNDLVLYNDELHLDKNKILIKNDSKEIIETTDSLIDYLDDINDIFLIESNITPNNTGYQLNTLIDNINNKILPLAKNKSINFKVNVEKNSFLNYIGDIDKIEKIISNIIYNVIENTDTGKDIILNIDSKQNGTEKVELIISIISNGNTFNTESAKLTINDFIESDEISNKYDLKMIISNELLRILNSKIDIKEDKNDTVYSFAIIQGFNDNILYSK